MTHAFEKIHDSLQPELSTMHQRIVLWTTIFAL